MNTSSKTTTYENIIQIKDGYDLPVYGIAEGTFYTLHVPAMACICISFICAISVILYSFYRQNYSKFFDWSKSERFVVYMALCDALFNVSHFSDHLHIVVTKSFPTPKGLCAFYGFMLAEFISAQNLMVNIVAINVFVLIYFRKQMFFGRWDYRLLVYIFGVPAIGCIIAGALDQFGPNGAFCTFDALKGKTTYIFFTTVPLLLVLVLNIGLYTLSWGRIYRETREIKDSLGKSSRALQASHKAAKTMSLFVTAFFIQWWALAVFGVCQLSGNVPPLLLNLVTTFSNIGGLLNGIVFIFIVQRKSEKASDNGSHKSGSGGTGSTPIQSISHLTRASHAIRNSEV
ncbi:uncharacterized protein LOC143069224 [Mytilus galloprovincialis]|uniref:uncharacterized protein LOC143069224 n=1 Tax=Mytilus galloprovincialis TaxID=29158 RepID=UPI003F7B929C